MTFRGRNVDISLVILMFSEMHMFWQVCSFGKVEGRKEVRGESTEVKKCTSLYESDNHAFLCFFIVC